MDHPLPACLADDTFRCLRLYLPPASPVGSIGRLANQFYFVTSEATAKDLIEDLKHLGDVWAIGVVNRKGEGLGIITVSQFQAKMSLPFAYDVLGRHKVLSMMEPTKSFSWDKHVLAVAEKLEQEVEQPKNSYYLLKNASGTFAGIFSSKDLLISMFKVYRQDLKLAVTIQTEMIPEVSFFEKPGLQIHAFCKMAKGVGGDFYAYKEYAPGRWAVLLCDVSGKGAAASLVTTALGGMFSLYDFDQGMKPFIQKVNEFVLKTFRLERYLTGVFLTFSEQDSKLTVYDMGHRHLRLLRGDKAHELSSENPFLGFVPTLDPQPRLGILHPGDTIALFSDGFAEQQDAKGHEFGLERLEKILTAGRKEDLPHLADNLRSAVKVFRGDQPRGDDQCLLLLRLKIKD
ncbi:MAG: serine/threonine-protein phosphatase [Spirochaetales bacterium]|nr:serine/threonine-protein phosphatase [Spirochaetales bacterium]